MRRAAFVLLAALVGAPLPVLANDALNAPATLTTGELVALQAQQFFGNAHAPDAVVAFDKAKGKIVCAFTGNLTSVEEARTLLDQIRGKTLTRIRAFAQRFHSITLEEADFTLVYYSQAGEKSHELLRREDGRYVMP